MPLPGILASAVTGNLVVLPSSVEYLVVAGGGGSGIGPGGGGGMRTSTLSVSAGTTYTVTVGAGSVNSSLTGETSTFASINATGGGTQGLNGGTGGGYYETGVRRTGNAGGYSPSEGANGGYGFTGSSNPWKYTSGGGGGGGASGQDGSNAASAGNAGAGGNGTQSSITGTSTYYAGGGAGGQCTQGGVRSSGASTPSGGAGGAGYNQAGAQNQGAGAGASSTATDYAGGSGVVIIRYADTFSALTSTTGSPTITNTGGYRIYKWTGSGSVTI